MEQVVPITSGVASIGIGGGTDGGGNAIPSSNIIPTTASDVAVAAGHILNTVGTTAMSTLTNVTVWSKNMAESWGVLPEPVQEFSNSIRAIATIKLPIIYDDGIMGDMTTTAIDGKSIYEAAFIRSVVTDGEQHGQHEGQGQGQDGYQAITSDKAAFELNKIAVVTRDGHYYRYNMCVEEATTNPTNSTNASIPTSTSDTVSDVDRTSNTSVNANTNDGGGVTIGGVRCTLEDEAIFL